jgi:hypothetical protein
MFTWELTIPPQFLKVASGFWFKKLSDRVVQLTKRAILAPLLHCLNFFLAKLILTTTKKLCCKKNDTLHMFLTQKAKKSR